MKNGANREHALEVFHAARAICAEDDTFSMALIDLGRARLYKKSGNFTEAGKMYENAYLRIKEENNKIPRNMKAKFMHEYAGFKYEQNDIEGAESLYRNSIQDYHRYLQEEAHDFRRRGYIGNFKRNLPQVIPEIKQCLADLRQLYRKQKMKQKERRYTNLY